MSGLHITRLDGRRYRLAPVRNTASSEDRKTGAQEYCNLNMEILAQACLLLTSMTVLDALQCKKINSCKCEMDDGSGIVNLRSLAHPGNLPKWTLGGGDGWMYKYNPCLGYAMGRVDGLAVSQASTGGSVYDLGIQSSASFNLTDNGRLVLSYTARDEKRSTSIILKCDRETRFDRLEFVGEISIAKYEMFLSSPCACPGYCDDFGLHEAVAKNMSGYWEHARGPEPPPPPSGAGGHDVAQSSSFPWSDVGTSMIALLFHDIVLIVAIASCIVLVKHFKSTCGRICAGTRRYQSGHNGYLAKECESVESGV